LSPRALQSHQLEAVSKVNLHATAATEGFQAKSASPCRGVARPVGGGIGNEVDDVWEIVDDSIKENDPHGKSRRASLTARTARCPDSSSGGSCTRPSGGVLRQRISPSTRADTAQEFVSVGGSKARTGDGNHQQQAPGLGPPQRLTTVHKWSTAWHSRAGASLLSMDGAGQEGHVWPSEQETAENGGAMD
jgi:hypothetical protein